LIDAVASGKAAARSIYRYVTGRDLRSEITEAHLVLDRYRREAGFERIPRAEIPTSPPEGRLSHPAAQVEIGYAPADARREASRCLDCGVTPVFDGARCVLCGGCVDVCPTACLKIVPLDDIDAGDALDDLVARTLGAGTDRAENSAILKDEDRCIRCGLCEQRCPVDAITMERVTFRTLWRAGT
jgi:ferredoxin